MKKNIKNCVTKVINLVNSCSKLINIKWKKIKITKNKNDFLAKFVWFESYHMPRLKFWSVKLSKIAQNARFSHVQGLCMQTLITANDMTRPRSWFPFWSLLLLPLILAWILLCMIANPRVNSVNSDRELCFVGDSLYFYFRFWFSNIHYITFLFFTSTFLY